MGNRTVAIEDAESLAALRAAIAQRGGAEVSEAKAVNVAVGVALKGLGAHGDSAIYSTSALQRIMRERTFLSTVESLKIALSHFEPDAFEVLADPSTCSIELRRVTEGIDQTVIIREAQTGAVGSN